MGKYDIPIGPVAYFYILGKEMEMTYNEATINLEIARAIVSGLSEIVVSMSNGSIARKRIIRCLECNETFNYWSPWITEFNCPCCRKQINIER